jgi:hypothetical protein
MQTSFPSKKIIVADVPEVAAFKAEFIYNFFTKDERSNDSGIAPNYSIIKSAESLTEKYTEDLDFNRFVPRYVNLTWKPVTAGNRTDLIAISVEKNFSKIHKEQDFSSGDYSPVFFQDTGLDGKLKFYVSKALEHLDTAQNTNNSPLDYARRLNTQTDPNVSSEFLTTVLSRTDKLGISFSGQSQEDLLEELKQVKFNVKLNNKLIAKTLKTLKEDVVTPFVDEISPIISKAITVETNAQSVRNSAVFDADDYEFEIRDYVTLKPIDAANYDSVVQTIGYVIERFELLPNGTSKTLKPIFIENPQVATCVDTQVKYGGIYVYNISSIAYVENQVRELNDGEVFAVGFLVSSQPSLGLRVECTEMVPPPSPADFNVFWDQKQQCSRLSWSFPPNRQRDIKKFQVFRRGSIRDPFELIKMYDFDDSEIKSPYYETPDPILVETNKNPKTIFYDLEFKKESKFIYSVCSVDAHGLSSGYSVQYEVSFDRFNNKLVKKIISLSGAPKAYPNAFLNVDTFVDSIKDENHNRLKIVFNPEFLKVLDGKENDVGLLKTNSSDRYKLQIINTELQKQEIIEIQLENRTSNILDKK